MTAVKKILVIDDDVTSSRLIDEVLSRFGLEVQALSDPRAGYEKAKSDIPDLIFINLLLSGINGLKVSKAIHAVKGLEQVPIILLISYQGELDSKYTATIGIVDTLVKPLIEAEIVAKTRAILGYDAVAEPEDLMVREISLEDEMEPMILREEVEMIEEQAPDSVIEIPAENGMQEHAEPDESETVNEMTKEGEASMKDKDKLFDRKDDDDRDLFADEPDIFEEELKKSRAEQGSKLHEEGSEGDSFPEVDMEQFYEEEKPVSPLRRILLVAGSVVVGIALGVGAYLFFTAGKKQAPIEKQAATTVPEPAPVAPVIPSDKPNVIPEIPVKTEPQNAEQGKAGSDQPKEVQQAQPTKGDSAVAKKESAPKAPSEMTPVSAAPAVVKPDDKKTLAQKQQPKKETGAAVKGKRAYYVQAGLFENQKNAEALAEKLKQKGFAPTVNKMVNADKKTLYRVSAGSYAGFKKALEISESLNKQGIKTVVKK